MLAQDQGVGVIATVLAAGVALAGPVWPAGGAAGAWAAPVATPTVGTAGSPGDTWLVVITGVGGDDEHRVRFVELARRLIATAVADYGVARDHVRYLAERVALAPELATARSTAEEIARVLGEVARAAGADDVVWIVLFGHGSASGEGARFNLPGPDMGPAEFAPLLQAFGDRRVVFVNTASSSGPFAKALAAPGRIIVTATRSAAQREEPRFAERFVDAFAGGGADLDKDGAVSVLEAFRYADTEVARSYDESGHLRVENALLEADGDGEASTAPRADEGDGAVANTVRLGRPALARLLEEGARDPVIEALLQERARVQEQIDALRARKASLSENEYLERLEPLLVRLAEIDSELRRRQGGSR